MSINVAGVGSVPIVWKPSPDHYNGRNGQTIVAIVHHRAVSSKLSSMDATLISSTRQVSANFGIGHVSGKVEIHQYVDLSDGAWCNGDCQQDAYPSLPSNFDKWWGHHDHNARTVSIEHEDNGGDTTLGIKGIVDEDVLLASMALDKLMLSGNLAAMRAAGIHIRDAATATQLGKIIPGPRTLIDHHDIAGKLKPYCWKPWKYDTVGFPRTRYIAATIALPDTSTEDDMPALISYQPGYTCTVKSGMRVRSAPTLSAPTLRVTSGTEAWTIAGSVKGDLDTDCNGDTWVTRWNAGKWEYTSGCNLVAPPAPPVVVDTTPFSQDDLNAARAKGIADAAAAAAGVK